MLEAQNVEVRVFDFPGNHLGSFLSDGSDQLERIASVLVSARTGESAHNGSHLDHVLAATEPRVVVVDSDESTGVSRLI